MLFEPGATVPIVVAPPTVTLREDPKHSVYRIRTPAAGRWTYTVQVRKSGGGILRRGLGADLADRESRAAAAGAAPERTT